MAVDRWDAYDEQMGTGSPALRDHLLALIAACAPVSAMVAFGMALDGLYPFVLAVTLVIGVGCGLLIRPWVWQSRHGRGC